MKTPTQLTEGITPHLKTFPAIASETKTGDVKLYLEVSVRARKQLKMRNRGKYSCLEHLVLEQGEQFKFQPHTIHRGPMKHCFENTVELVLKREDLTYCEGYAAGIIPVLHAWAVDKHGNVVDPTWSDDTSQDYYGIRFKTDYLFKALSKKKHYGLLDDWQNDWPLMTLNPKLWKEQKHEH